MRLSVLCIVFLMIGCTQDDLISPSVLGDEMGHYQTSEQALRGGHGRGHDTLHDNGTTDSQTEETGEISSSDTVLSEQAEVATETSGRVPAPREDPGPMCAPDPHREEHPRPNLPPQQAEPYVPSLWSEIQSEEAPSIVNSFAVFDPGEETSEVASAAARVELSDIGQLLEAYRDDGCADDSLLNHPRCRNHPYRLALDALFNESIP